MEKLYYSTKEVAQMFDVNQSTLRYWEGVYPQLKPKRTSGNTRLYTKKDIQTIKEITFLVKDQKLTLEGAKKKLGNKKDQVSKQQEITERLRKVKKELQGIARFLQEE